MLLFLAQPTRFELLKGRPLCANAVSVLSCFPLVLFPRGPRLWCQLMVVHLLSPLQMQTSEAVHHGKQMQDLPSVRARGFLCPRVVWVGLIVEYIGLSLRSVLAGLICRCQKTCVAASVHRADICCSMVRPSQKRW